MRLVILGGSGASTPELADSLAAWPGGVVRRPSLEVVLVGRSPDRLALVVAELGRRIADLDGPGVTIHGMPDRRAALEGADVVVNAVRVGGLEARVFDETFPQRHGIPGEETMGPGGFANALRTVPALRDTWRDVADVAPAALVVDLTNPAGIVVAAAEREAGLRILSVCDSPVTLCDAVAERLGRPVRDVRAHYVGMNHLGWWVPGSDDELGATADLAFGQDVDAVRALGAVGAAYVRYYLHPDRILEAQQAAGEVRAQQLQRLERDLLGGYRAGSGDLPRRGAAWYAKGVVPLVDAWVNGTDGPLIVGMRNDGRVPGLPDWVTVEGPVALPAPGRLEPLAAPVLPPLAGAMLARHATFEGLTVEAIASGSSRPALERALLANPMVSTWDQARALLDDILVVGGPVGA